MVMKRTALVIALALLATAGVARAQEAVSPAPASPVEGGKVMKPKAKAMTAVGSVKTVSAESLEISDASGKDWTFVIDAATKVVAKAHETVDVGAVSPVEGGKKTAGQPAGQEKVDAAPASPVEGGKVIPPKAGMISDIKEGQRVQVTYHEADGKRHATRVRVM
jgi:hypothetical protein